MVSSDCLFTFAVSSDNSRYLSVSPLFREIRTGTETHGTYEGERVGVQGVPYPGLSGVLRTAKTQECFSEYVVGYVLPVETSNRKRFVTYIR